MVGTMTMVRREPGGARNGDARESMAVGCHRDQAIVDVVQLDAAKIVA
jgi:hypothetical protein